MPFTDSLDHGTTILSHFVTEQETMFVSFLTSIGFIWSALLFLKIITHVYLWKKCIDRNLHAGRYGVHRILSLLFVNLVGRMMTFVSNVYREVAFRT